MQRLIEIWFGILSRKALRGASFNSAEQLAQAIKDFVAAYNNNANPFVWRSVKSKALSCVILSLIYAIKH